MILEICVSFTDCIRKINNEQLDSVKDLNIVMPMYNLIEYSHNYAKISGSLRQYYKTDLNDNIADSESFKFRRKITGTTPAGGNTKDVEIAAPLKCLINVWRTQEIPLINCKINVNLIGKLCYYQFNRCSNICNNRYKALLPSGNSVN